MQQKKNKPFEGFFITVEGGDGCGKTSVAQALVSFLEKKGYGVVHTREPGGTPFSEQIRQLVLMTDSSFSIHSTSELLLFLAARAQHIEEKILPALHSGNIVLCERFNDSSIAYQGSARHLGMPYVEELCGLACHGLQPDCTLLLDVDPEIGLKRAQKQRKQQLDRLEQEHVQFHQEVRQGFLHLADRYPERIEIIDASLSLEQVILSAQKALDTHLLLKPSKHG